MAEAFDLDAYLKRIGYGGPREPTPVVLEEVHLGHLTHIPFENLDAFLGQPTRLDLASLQAKMVQGRRGGTCLSQNTLLAAALEALGFRVTRLAGRVRVGATTVRPRGHMLLRVEAGGTAWLADVGFGGNGLLKPVPLVPTTTVRQYHWEYRIVEEPALLVLQSRCPGGWLDMYTFTLEPHYPVDYEVIKHYYSTHPNVKFHKTLTFQRPTPEARYMVRDRELTVERASGIEKRYLADEEELRQTLAQDIGLDLPRDLLAAALEKIPLSG